MHLKVRDEFLKTYTDKLLSSLRKDCSFSNFCDVFSKKGFKTSTTYNYEDTYYHVKELKEVLDKITAIVFKPHIKSDTEAVVLRSELSSALSPSSFSKTMRDSKLWKNKRGEMTPEYVHSEQHIDTIVTYENIFISMLVDEISDEIESLLNNLTPLVKSLEEEYEVKGINYGIHSLFNQFKPFEYPYEESFMKEKTSTRKIFVLARKLFKRVKNIKATEFYRLTHKTNITNEIVPTNILTHDRIYAYCYRFYLDNYLKAKDEDIHKLDIYYYNYFVSLLIQFMAKNKIGHTKQTKLSEFVFDKEQRISFDKITFKKGMFAFEIKPDSENLGIYIDVKLINNAVRSDTKVKKDKFAKYYVLTTFTYSEANQPLLDSILKDKREQYDDVILATQNNVVLDFLNVINISTYSEDNEQLINNLIASFTMLFISELEIYEDKCPVCGKKQIGMDDKEYVCLACKSRYSLLNINNKEMIWIKSFRRKEKW